MELLFYFLISSNSSPIIIPVSDADIFLHFILIWMIILKWKRVTSLLLKIVMFAKVIISA